MRHGSRPIWLRYGDGVRKDSGYAALRAMTFLAALCCDQLTAPCVFDGPINGEGFRAYVNQQPVPTLEPDDIVIMDNPGGHKSKAVREAIKHAGARLWFLSPYSPDPNPIEQTFSKIKHWMRMAQKRTIEETWRHVGTLLGTIAAKEGAGYFKNAGYQYVKAFPLIHKVYPAAWKKFHHSSGVKRSQISPMASMSWSKVPAPMRPRWALSLRAARAALSLLCVARLSGMTPDPGSSSGIRTFSMQVSTAARCIAPEITPRDHPGCHDAVT